MVYYLTRALKKADKFQNSTKKTKKKKPDQNQCAHEDITREANGDMTIFLSTPIYQK